MQIVVGKKRVNKDLVEYHCDFCGKILTENDLTFEGGTLHCHFGFGSKFDSFMKANPFPKAIDCCDNCFEKVILKKIKKVIK